MRNRTDIYLSLLYHYFSDYTLALPESERRKFSGTGSLGKLKTIFVNSALELKRNIKVKPLAQEELHNKIWVFAYSQNDFDALAFAKKIEGAVFVAERARKLKNCDKLYVLPYPSRLPYLHHYPSVLKSLVHAKKERASDLWDFIWTSIGWYESTFELLKKYRPKALLLTNDHSCIPRAMLLAGKALGIPTIFVQHASVTRHFPPLAFDLSLLEGQAAWDNYKTIGNISGRVELVGMPKFDKFVSLRKKPQPIQSIGIAFNLIDDLDKILKICEQIHAQLPDIQLCLRPHPKDPVQHDWSATHPYISKSTGAKESAFEFLGRHDAIIANNTSIHLEALLLNMPSFYLDISRADCKVEDLYGYVANKLVPFAESADDIVMLIQKHNQQPTDLYHKAKYYNALVDTPQEGHSEELVIQYIKDFVN